MQLQYLLQAHSLLGVSTMEIMWAQWFIFKGRIQEHSKKILSFKD
jgi:hypothetical protein